MEDSGNIRQLVCQRIGEVENAMKSLQSVRKTILHKAYEAKQSILNTFVSERESMQNKEMGLLMEVDKLLHSKDDVLVIQLSKLSQVLGCLRNCLESPHPCHDCLEKFDDIDMLSVSEVSIEFSHANEMLKDTLRSYQEFNHSSPPSPAIMDTEDNITKWLLTPTNNHLTEADLEQGRQEFISTEWLLQHHASPHSGVDAANHFTKVKAEGHDEWLEEGRSTPNPLYMYALQQFYSITTQDHNDWLQREDYERSRSLSDSDNTASTSSSSSVSSASSVNSDSCVVLPSITSSDASSQSFVLLEEVWSKRGGSHSPSYEVHEWVSTCRSEADDDWLSTSKDAAAASGPEESVCDAETPTAAEWLHQPTGSSTILADCGSDVWLVTRGRSPSTVSGYSDTKPESCDWLATDQPVHQDTDLSWLTFNTTKGENMEILPSKWQEEKCDVSFKKLSEDDWLAKYSSTPRLECTQWLKFGAEKLDNTQIDPLEDISFKLACFRTTDWLSMEEKVDQPEQTMRKARSADKEWLLIKNHMSKISASEGSGWLLENHEAEFAKLPPRDNRESESRLWLC